MYLPLIATDPDRWIGFTNDEAEVAGWCFWLRLGPWRFYWSPLGLHVDR